MRNCFAMAAAALVLAVAGPALGQETAGATLAVSGPEEMVFDWAKQACVKSHVPDAPARAFRDADGNVHLIASHNDNRRFSGPDLNNLRPECTVIYQAEKSNVLDQYDDMGWISGLWTGDGKTVYALAHMELRGNRAPGLCSNKSYSSCLLNTVTALVSRDGGKTFAPEKGSGATAMVANLPYPFPNDRKARVGYANPTNIIKRDGWYYAMVFADGYRDQKRGNCVLRTRDLSAPSSWRAFDGKDFAVEFIDPFRQQTADAKDHVCAPVSTSRIGRMIGSISEYKGTDVVIAVFGDRRTEDGKTASGIYASTSRDLVHWSEPTLVFEAPLLWEDNCGAEGRVFYPALLDPEAKAPSFQDTGDKAYLYFTRYRLTGCKVTWDRDLVRVPVAISMGGTVKGQGGGTAQ